MVSKLRLYKFFTEDDGSDISSSVVQIFVTDAAGSKQTHIQQSNKYPLPKRTRMSVVPHSSDVFCFAKNSRLRIDKDVHSEAARMPRVLNRSDVLT